VLRTPQRMRRFPCLQDCLLTLTCQAGQAANIVVCRRQISKLLLGKKKLMFPTGDRL
jgi:hypothetical protein